MEYSEKTCKLNYSKGEKMITDDKGFCLNKGGEYIHPDMIKADEKLKDDVVGKLIDRAKSQSEALKTFKTLAFEEVDTYMHILLESYGVNAKATAKKGNLTLEDYAGLRKVQIAIAESIKFDEKLQGAKVLIDEFLEEETRDSSANIQTLVKKAFDTDKEGAVSPHKILPLRNYDIKHPKWQKAMEIISDSIKVTAKKPYIRFYIRESQSEPYKLINLDIAGVEIENSN